MFSSLSAVAHPVRQVAAQVAGIVAEQLKTQAAKSIEGMAIDFEVRLSEAVTDFFNGDATAADVGRIMRQLIRSDAMDMYQEGMKEGGIENPEDELSDEDEATVSQWVTDQLSYVPDFIQAIKDTRKKGTTEADQTAAQQGILDRIGLWRDSLTNLGDKGKLSALGNIMLTFDGSDGKENCDECRRYKGQRHRRDWWDKNGLLDRNGNENYGCGRWENCEHHFFDDKGNVIVS